MILQYLLAVNFLKCVSIYPFIHVDMTECQLFIAQMTEEL